jgi:sugar phosphate isomerase/epimerase
VSDARRTTCPKDKMFEEFAVLCEQARQRGTRVMYEMVPFSGINSLQSALELVKGAGAKNGGILFDIWHVTKLGIPYDKVWEFPIEHFFGIEIGDGYVNNPPTENLMEETVNYRTWCGQGEFDVKGYLSHMPKSQYRGPVGVEVCSKEIRSWPLEKLASTAYKTSIVQFPSFD